jgi:hypothetical protein
LFSPQESRSFTLKRDFRMSLFAARPAVMPERPAGGTEGMAEGSCTMQCVPIVVRPPRFHSFREMIDRFTAVIAIEITDKN